MLTPNIDNVSYVAFQCRLYWRIIVFDESKVHLQSKNNLGTLSNVVRQNQAIGWRELCGLQGLLSDWNSY